MSRAKRIMVQGTMSGAGKSLLCAALCRIFAQDGYRVAPFKSQNMALNSFVTRDGLEMGRAQVVQAQAAGIEPDVRMNPILLKPSSDTGSQVIVGGEVRGQMSAADYFKMKRQLIPDILAAFNSLSEDVDIVVIEGAGSPAEINLKADDIVNMGLAKLVDAPVLLAGDIDRGGVFAQLYGTVALLEQEERARIAGLIINKFRGDVEILRPGLAMLEEKTGLPVLGVVPYLHVEIEDEDSLSERLNANRAVKPLDAAVIRLPHISNFTDFMPLEQHELLGVRYVQRARELGRPDLVILPGTKNTMEDLLWLRQNGLEAAALKLAHAGTPMASASFLRGLPQPDWEPFVPARAAELYGRAAADGLLLDGARLETAVLALLRMQDPADFAQVRGVSEGLENRLTAAVREADSLDDLYTRLKTKRYPHARLRRLVLDAALGFPAELPMPPYLHVLGARKAALPRLKRASLPAATALADLARTGPEAAKISRLHNKAVDFSSLCREKIQPMGLAFTAKPVVI